MAASPRLWPAAGILALCMHAVWCVALEGVPTHSFKGPFTTFNRVGGRLVPNFVHGGSVQLGENFIRLTAEKSGNRGWLHSESVLDLEQWTATLQFRVSGKGKDMFGEGFAFWFTTEEMKEFESGEAGDFNGFGVIFSTFRNPEVAARHHDVALSVHSGTSDVAMTAFCDGDFRYSEARADFSVANRSAVRITFDRNKVSVGLDARNTGEFSSCISDAELSLPAEWHKKARVGITATTGQGLSDNHDIISLLITPGVGTVSTAEDAFAGTGDAALDAHIRTVVAAASKPVDDKLAHLSHHLEHQLSAIQSTLQANLKKLEEHEAAVVTRIVELESRVGSHLDNTLDEKVGASLEASLEGRLAAVETDLHAVVDQKVSDKVYPVMDAVAGRVETAGRAWVWPFVFLLALALVLSLVGMRGYKTLLKTHLL